MGLLDKAIGLAAESLLNRQQGDGHWLFELEADATIPAEYILLQHYLGRVEPELQQRIAAFLRAGQGEDGGWPLFHGGALDLSSSVKTYFALKASRRPDRCAAHGARAGGDPGARRRAALQRLYPHPAWPSSAKCRGARCR